MARTRQGTRQGTTTEAPIPSWLRFVLASDRAGSAWYVGLGFFFAPALAVVSPWPFLTGVLWIVIGLAGLWLGLLGIAMAVGLGIVLRSGSEIPEDYWRSIIDYDDSAKIAAGRRSLPHSDFSGTSVVNLPVLDAVEPTGP